MRIFRRHPSRQALAIWLGGGAPDLDEHLATCTRCASSIEELESTEQPLLAVALAELFEAPEGLSERLERRVTERMEDNVFFEVASELFGAGVETARLLALDESADGTDAAG
jgi:hypothetical protein